MVEFWQAINVRKVRRAVYFYAHHISASVYCVKSCLKLVNFGKYRWPLIELYRWYWSNQAAITGCQLILLCFARSMALGLIQYTLTDCHLHILECPYLVLWVLISCLNKNILIFNLFDQGPSAENERQKRRPRIEARRRRERRKRLFRHQNVSLFYNLFHIAV